MNELNNYLAVRKAFFNDDNPFPFPAKAIKGISANRLYPVFHQAVEDIGINEPARLIDNMHFGAPTPHSLKHSFAVNTLKHIKQQGKLPQQTLPVLSVYMSTCNCKLTGQGLISDYKKLFNHKSSPDPIFEDEITNDSICNVLDTGNRTSVLCFSYMVKKDL